MISTGRDGNDILARTVAHDEDVLDFGIQMAKGERLLFPADELKISIHNIGQENPTDSNGYAPVANTIWTWLQLPGGIGAVKNKHALYYFESAGRRLDTAYNLCMEALDIFDKSVQAIQTEPYMHVRAQMFQALGCAELMCVSLHRALDMLISIPNHFSVSLDTAVAEAQIMPSLTAIRHAVEHIDERTVGNVNRRSRSDAYSIFDQREFFGSYTLTYATHSLNLRSHIIPTIVSCRGKLFQAVVDQAGEARSNNSAIVALDDGVPDKNGSESSTNDSEDDS